MEILIIKEHGIIEDQQIKNNSVMNYNESIGVIKNMKQLTSNHFISNTKGS